MKIKRKFINIVKKLDVKFIVLLTLLVFSILISLNTYTTNVLNKEINRQISLDLKQKVTISYNTISPLIKELNDGKITKKEAINRITNLVSRMTYSDSFSSNYLFMSDYDGDYLVQPYEPSKVGTNMWNFTNDKGDYVIRRIIKTAKKNPKGSYIEYESKKPNSTIYEKKRAYIIGIPEINAYIGTGTYLETSYTNILSLISMNTQIYYLVILISIFLFLIYSIKHVIINKELQSEILEKEKAKQNLMIEKAKVLDEKHKFEVLFEYSHDAILEFDNLGNIIRANNAFVNLYKYTKSECQGSKIYDLIAKEEPYKSDVINHVKDSLNAVQNNIETTRFDKNGKAIHVLLRTVFLRQNDLVIGGYVIYTDITKTKKYEERLIKLSIHDNLTGLFNSNYFNDKTDEISKKKIDNIAVIVSDINGLKLINDSFGHKFGNKIIKDYANILKEIFSAESVIARTGGDEFYIIIYNSTFEKISFLMNKHNKKIDDYNNIEKNNIVKLSVAIGYSVSDSENIRVALKDADDMMYRNKLLNRTSRRNQMLALLLSILKEKDYVTKGHTDRVKEMSLKMSQSMHLSNDRKDKILLLAEVHDLGKIAIPDSILNKKAILNRIEWKKMKTHSEIGYRIAINSQELSDIADLILKHHERWDGEGYPLKIKGEEIPIECRILSLVDAYDAMTNQRPYNILKTHKEAIEEIKLCAGSQFDPSITEVFLKLFDS
ncbi:hypothetical protein HLPR_14110 [Helicovermis profundi]|uniref:Diguanylate cyclase n=1 Tax=Helicovermis profundi TaxID=3065157 RepID=A0AAU9ERI7_9FIRM|nr:hypothetical protein HLPR_14110 [Clostridia bacterium S502]